MRHIVAGPVKVRQFVQLLGPWIWDIMGHKHLTKETHMFIILKTFKYIRGLTFEVPSMVSSGHKTLEEARKAQKALETLNDRPDLQRYVIATITHK